MPKPKTKKELLEASRKNYEELITLVNSFSKEEQETEFPEGTLNRNIRDVIAHLHHWHLMFLDWYKTGMKGEKPDMPTKGFKWKELPKLNSIIREKYQSLELQKAKRLFRDSYNKVREIIKKHSDKELFEKKKYKWTGSTSLGAYIIANSSSHYKWAYNLINKAKKK